MVTFDQVAEGETAVRVSRSIFSLANLRNGVFALLPPARIAELLARFERIDAKRGDVLIREGDEGDYYYVIESGRCRVERVVGGVSVALAELKSGDAFGEEALASDARRNATVSLATDGRLLRLGKKDFKELLGEPLLQRLSYAEGLERVARGAAWLDVRYPSEYRYDRLPGRASTCRSTRCATASRCSIAPGSTSCTARAGGAARRRRSCSRSAASRCACWRAACGPPAAAAEWQSSDADAEKHVNNHGGGCRMAFNPGLR